MNKAEYVRIRALEDVIIAFLSDEEKALIHELKKLGPNLNQIAHTGNTEGLTAIHIVVCACHLLVGSCFCRRYLLMVLVSFCFWLCLFLFTNSKCCHIFLGTRP